MWNPPIALSPEEQKIAARTQKARKFFVFLRTIRHELLDADFQQMPAKSYSPEPGVFRPSPQRGIFQRASDRNTSGSDAVE